MPSKSKHTAIVIVGYKTPKLLADAKKRYSAISGVEVICVDTTKKNKGYGAGCNSGLKHSTAEFVVFMNADVIMPYKQVQILVDTLKKNPRIGIVGPQLRDENNAVVPSCTQQLTMLRLLASHSFLQKLPFFSFISQEYKYHDWDRATTKEVGVLSGAVFAVRSSDLAQIHGFDENFFLYWEEHDLCARIAKLGKSVVFLSQSKAVHLGERSTQLQNKDELREYSDESIRHYSKKHFGLIASLVLQAIFFILESWREIAVFGTAFILRIIHGTNVPFIEDVARDYNQALNLLQGKSFPLLGIPSSIPRFSQSVFNVWFDAMSFQLGGAHLFSPPLFAALSTAIGCVLLYVLLKRVSNKNVAVVLAIFGSVLPLHVMYSWMPFYLFSVPFWTAAFILAVTTHSKSIWKVVGVGVAASMLLNWELATLPLLGLLALYLLKIRLKLTHLLALFGSFILPQLPRIVYDVFHHCEQMCMLVAWSGYRLVATTGYDSRHGWSLSKAGSMLESFWYEWQRLMGGGYWFIAAAIVLLGVVGIVSNRKSKNEVVKYSFFGLVLLTVGIVLHGSPSEAYFPPYIVLWLVFIAAGIQYFSKQMKIVILLGLLICSAFFIRLHAQRIAQPTSLQDQIHLAQKLVEDSKDEQFAIRFESAETQLGPQIEQYTFLLRTMNGKVDEENATISYILSKNKPASMLGVNSKLWYEHGMWVTRVDQ